MTGYIYILRPAYLLLVMILWMETICCQHHHRQPLKARPVIAVLAEHQHQLLPNQSYIASSYVKYLEASGAKVVPIPRHFEERKLQELFSYVNGVFFPGGGEYYEFAQTFLDMTIKANDRGDYFPIWGTCFGFQVLHLAVLGKLNKTILSKCESVDKALSLKFIEDTAMQSRLFRNASAEIYNILRSENVTYNYHNYGVTRNTYKKYPKLNEFFKILSVNNDEMGQEFISTVEAHEYPIYGVQWHPEKNNFEYTHALKEIPHSSNAVLATQYMSNFFVNEARKNQHKFPTQEMESKYLIYNYSPVHAAKKYHGGLLSHFEQIYIFEG